MDDFSIFNRPRHSGFSNRAKLPGDSPREKGIRKGSRLYVKAEEVDPDYVTSKSCDCAKAKMKPRNLLRVRSSSPFRIAEVEGKLERRNAVLRTTTTMRNRVL